MTGGPRTEAKDPTGIVLFAAGVEPENAPSIGCLQAVGFAQTAERPDWEGMLYFLYRL